MFLLLHDTLHLLLGIEAGLLLLCKLCSKLCHFFFELFSLGLSRETCSLLLSSHSLRLFCSLFGLNSSLFLLNSEFSSFNGRNVDHRH